jgi:hypothetical protein
MIGSNGFLDQFPLPEAAAKALSRPEMQMKNLGDGVSTFAGHDNGTAFRFFTEPVYSVAKSRRAKYEVFDEIEMIQWFNDGFNSPTEQVRFLPPTLLAFERDEEYNDRGELKKVTIGAPIGGKYLESYMRFKQGKKRAGDSAFKMGRTFRWSSCFAICQECFYR